ncbi:MAG TPA: prepilin peptidase [Candidatus Paceibacterota bacterium]|nr:prepilin peptidase [Candidatus Paceibacterota bacterium]
MEYFFSVMPTSFVVTLAFIFGVIIGSFLNVYIYRFHTGKSLTGSSHCLSCGTPLRFFELFPLLSYLFLWGRCRTCRSYIPSRYFWVELLTGSLFVAAALTFTDSVLFFLTLASVSVLVVIAVYDLYHMIIPDELTLALLVLVLGGQFYALILGMTFTNFMWNVGAALLASLFFLLLWRFSEGKWIGFGDVKLVIPLALGVGYASVFSLVVLAFWIGAALGLIILAVQKLKSRGQPHLRFLPARLTMKSAVPFAPFLILSYLAIIFFGIDVISLLSYA